MLYPQENKIRGIIDLNGVWDLHLGQRRNRGCGDIAGTRWCQSQVPGSYNDHKDVLLTGIITVMRITGEILQCLLITRDRDWCFALTQ